MKLVIGLLLGAVSPTYLSKDQLLNESTEEYSICADPYSRWKDGSNAWGVYKKYLTQSSAVFQDSLFKADMSSVYSTAAPPKAARQAQYNKMVVGWKRPSEIYPKEAPKLLGSWGELKPSGIKQGGLSDCWFLAGATAMAEDATRLDKVIHVNSRKSYNGQGIFRYYFWVYDDWYGINIDDRLPVRYKYSNSKDYFSTVFAGRSKFGAWWMPLLEKAYSKLNGNYDRIEWGSGYESMRQLSNSPVFFFKHSKVTGSADEVFRMFAMMASQNFPMVTSCCDSTGAAPDGLVANHAYTLLDVKEVGGTRLAKIRNPWSKEGYHGKWSDSDPVWTPSLLKQAGHKIANDGVFFMPFSQFLNKPYFRSTTAAVYQKFAKTQLFKVTQTVEQLSITVNIPSTQVVYFTLEAQNPRFKKNCGGGQDFVNTFFFKGTRFPGMSGLEVPRGYLGGSMYHVTVGKPNLALSAGTHTIMVANWNFKKTGSMTYTLQVYQEGSGTVSVKY